MSEEKKQSAQSWTQLPTRIKKFIYSIVAIIVALTVLVAKFDELVDSWSALWQKLFPPGLDYVVFVLDASAHMDEDFDAGQSKWYSLVSGVRTALPLYDPENIAVRTFGGSCLDPKSTRLAVEFGDKTIPAIEEKVAGITVNGDDAPLFKALAETVDDFRKEKRLGKTDPSLTNRVIVVSGGSVCDYNEMAFKQLRERFNQLGISLEFSLIGMKAEGAALKQLATLAQELDGKLYAVDKGNEVLNALEKKDPVDALTKAKEYYGNEQDERALPLFEMYKDDVDAKVYRANIHANKNSPARDEKKAIELYREAGDAGNGEALYQLGNIYSDKGEKESARQFWEKAVDLGFDLAKEKLKDLTAAK